MNPERWERVRAVFDSAVDRSAADAEEFLRAECAGDAELYAEVRRMLEENRRAGFLDRSPAPGGCFPAGSVVANRYRILRSVGRGGMGQVYEAEDLELHERVALKALLPGIAADSGMVARFKREIQLARKIGHPNVCRVFDLARDPAEGSSPTSVLFLTMEFLEGETLTERIERDGRIPAPEALPLLAQMADALDAAHRAGIIHRDFKPSNVMLAAGTRGAVVTDFGLARSIAPSPESTATVTGRLIGTIDYMAPELFTGGEASAASDIYAFGLVAYKMIAGELPFASGSPLAGVVRRAGQALPPASGRVPGLDPAWDRALTCALDPDPARRFRTCTEFVEALRGGRPSVIVKLPQMTRRRVAGGGLAVVLLVAAPLAWRTWERARSRPSPEAVSLYEQGAADLHAGAYFAATKALEQAVRLAPSFTLAHARLAEAWTNLDLNDKASREMLIARRQDVAALSRLDRLQVEAIDLTITRDFAGAAAKYEQMIAAAGSQADDLYLDLGRAYENAGKPDKAIDAYRRAAEGPGHNPAAWLALGVLYNRKGNIAKSDEAFQDAEQFYKPANNLEGLTELAFQRGAAAAARNQFDTAAKFLAQALATARFAGNVHQEVRAELYLGTNAYRSGDTALAERYSREALDAARANQIEPIAVRGLIALGLAYSRKDAEGAERYYRQALMAARTGNSARLTALSLLSLAALHDSRGSYRDSEDEAKHALEFYEPAGFAKETFQCLTILGRARLRGADDVKGALEFFQRASAAAERAGDRNSEAIAEESMGSVLSAQERYPDAIPHLQRQMELSTTTEQHGYAALKLAETLSILGRYTEAQEAFRSAQSRATAFPLLHLNLLRARSIAELTQDHFGQAQRLAVQALTAQTDMDPRLRSSLEGASGLALASSGDVSRGLRLCREALQEALKTEEATTVIRARLDLAQALIRTGDSGGAVGVLRGHEPELAKFPESRWRALAVMSRGDPRYTAAARDAAAELERLWGAEAFQRYQSRADVRWLSRPFFRPVSANH